MFSSRVSPGVLVLVISMHADGLAARLDLRLQRPRSRNRMFSSRVSPGALVRVTWIHADGLAALHSGESYFRLNNYMFIYITVFMTRRDVGILGHKSQFDHIISRRSKPSKNISKTQNDSRGLRLRMGYPTSHLTTITTTTTTTTALQLFLQLGHLVSLTLKINAGALLPTRPILRIVPILGEQRIDNDIEILNGTALPYYLTHGDTAAVKGTLFQYPFSTLFSRRGLKTFLPKSSHRNVPANKVPVKKAPDTKRFPKKGSWIKGSC
jgi:hypothetical protein